MLGYSSSCQAERSRQQRHTTSIFGKRNQWILLLSSLSSLIQSRTQAQGMVLPTLWIDFPASVKLNKIILYKSCLVSQKILDSFKLTVDVKHWKGQWEKWKKWTGYKSEVRRKTHSVNLVFTDDVSEMENITDRLEIASYVFWYELRLGLLLI